MANPSDNIVFQLIRESANSGEVPTRAEIESSLVFREDQMPVGGKHRAIDAILSACGEAANLHKAGNFHAARRIAHDEHKRLSRHVDMNRSLRQVREENDPRELADELYKRFQR